MANSKIDPIPTNLIVGFLGSGKTSAIVKLIENRPAGDKWSILINEYGKVSIDHALVDSNLDGIEVKELGGGCACCTLAFAFKPLLAQFIRATKPDRLIIEPSGVSHPAKIVDILRDPNFASVIDLKNIICLIDPKDYEDPRWRNTAVFQDQIQLADIVVLNWTDSRDRELIDSCREWLETFRPPKQLIVETSFGVIDSDLLDKEFNSVNFPIFTDAHPLPENSELPNLELVSAPSSHDHDHTEEQDTQPSPLPGKPLRFRNSNSEFDACGWVFHLDDVFDRDELLDLLGNVYPIVRLKGVFHCNDDWWMINRAKEETTFGPSAYRRDSRLEIILDERTSGWEELETEILKCLVKTD